MNLYHYTYMAVICNYFTYQAPLHSQNNDNCPLTFFCAKTDSSTADPINNTLIIIKALLLLHYWFPVIISPLSPTFCN